LQAIALDAVDDNQGRVILSNRAVAADVDVDGLPRLTTSTGDIGPRYFALSGFQHIADFNFRRLLDAQSI